MKTIPKRKESIGETFSLPRVNRFLKNLKKRSQELKGKELEFKNK